MQGAEDEADGSIPEYVTKAEFRKQRRKSRIMTHHLALNCFWEKSVALIVLEKERVVISSAYYIFSEGEARDKEGDPPGEQ